MLTRVYPVNDQWAIEHCGRIVAHAIDSDTADRVAEVFDDCPECVEKDAAVREAERNLDSLADDIEEFLDALRLDTSTTLGKKALKAMKLVKAGIERSRS